MAPSTPNLIASIADEIDELFRENLIPMSDRNAAVYDRLRALATAQETDRRDWVMVPREPTQAMLHATRDVYFDQGGEGGHGDYELDRKLYRAMIAAAPPDARQDEGREAARYRWLREQPQREWRSISSMVPEAIDAAIDAAMSGEA